MGTPGREPEGGPWSTAGTGRGTVNGAAEERAREEEGAGATCCVSGREGCHLPFLKATAHGCLDDPPQVTGKICVRTKHAGGGTSDIWLRAPRARARPVGSQQMTQVGEQWRLVFVEQPRPGGEVLGHMGWGAPRQGFFLLGWQQQVLCRWGGGFTCPTWLLPPETHASPTVGLLRARHPP